MRRKTVIVVLGFLLFAQCADAGMPNPFRRRDKARSDYFPEEVDVPELERVGKILTYKNEKFQELYGTAGNRYLQYGMISMTTADYTYGGRDRRLTIEIVTMETPTAATGLFHYHRGNILDGRGTPVDVGAEGIVDAGRENRNLYFYRSNMFVKLIYSGKEPVPDLTPVASFIDSQLPAGRDARPDGFAYIEIDGVNKDTISLTSGFTFNISFLPPGITANAPGGGSVASDMFIITRQLDRDAAALYKDYTSYLKLYSDYVEEYKRGRQPYTKAVDPNQGRVVFTQYKNALIIAARPDGYEKGEALIDKVMAKMDSVEPDKKRKKEKEKEGGGGLFGRKGGHKGSKVEDSDEQ